MSKETTYTLFQWVPYEGYEHVIDDLSRDDMKKFILEHLSFRDYDNLVLFEGGEIAIKKFLNE